MSLAAIISNELDAEGISFRKGREKVSTQDVAGIIKNIVCKRLLTFNQGGATDNKYFCDNCAKKVVSG